MRWILPILFISRLALAYPAGAANEVVRVPSTGGPVETGAVDLTKSAAVTGLSATAIPYWNGVGAVGLADTNCTYNSGSGRFICPVFRASSASNTMIYADVNGDLGGMDNWTISVQTAFCSSSPCTIDRSFPTIESGLSSVTRSATGVYTVNFTGSYWTAAPSCIVGGGGATDGRYNCHSGGLSSTSSFPVNCYNQNSLADTSVMVVCTGKRN